MKRDIFILLIVFSFSCNDFKRKDCSTKVFNFNSQEFKASGCIVDKFEEGKWNFYDVNGKIIESGNFVKGIRTGLWHYPARGVDSVIEWKRYEKGTIYVVTNIPVLLNKIEDSADYVKFSNEDSSNLFNIVISVPEKQVNSEELSKYYEIGEMEIISKGWKFKSNRTKFAKKSITIYFNEYSIQSTEWGDFTILNIYREIEHSRIIEISCRFNKNIENSAKTIFYSILSNCFYKDERLINLF